MFGNPFSRAPDPSSVDIETFPSAVHAGEITVVDVREPNEFAAGISPPMDTLLLQRKFGGVYDLRALIEPHL